MKRRCSARPIEFVLSDNVFLTISYRKLKVMSLLHNRNLRRPVDCKF